MTLLVSHSGTLVGVSLWIFINVSALNRGFVIRTWSAILGKSRSSRISSLGKVCVFIEQEIWEGSG